MSYLPAFSSYFHGIDGTRWSVEISIYNYAIREQEIRLEHDEPLVIEWQETGKMDVVQSSTCTLKVSNESDRQMVELMTNRNAICSVYRGATLYWQGLLDDAVYEEPYSVNDGYVTELTFSDFGFLNRAKFTMTGRHSLRDIVDDCLGTAQLGSLQVTQMVSLVKPKVLTPATLEDLYVSCDRFQSSGSFGDGPSKRDVLEEILRPLGLRIMQKKGRIWIFDMEYLRDETTAVPVVWKGTDAYLRGAETFGLYEVAFDSDPEVDIIDGSVNSDNWNYVSSDRFWAEYRDDDNAEREVGFYFQYSLKNATQQRYVFRNRSHLSASDDYGYARRAWCYDSVNDATRNLLATTTPRDISTVAEFFSLQSGYIPLIPDRGDFQFRVTLDFLFSPKLNPFEAAEDWNLDIYETSWHTISWENWKEQMLRLYIPVKLEVVDGNGDVLYHYKNTNRYGGYLYPLDPGRGEWLSGAGTWGEMLLAYYKPGEDGHLHETALDGWATNKQTISRSRAKAPGVYAKRKDGEYVPLPPVPGYVRFTVSNGLVGLVGDTEPQMLLNFDQYVRWQLYRDPKVTVVRADMINDEVAKDDFKEQDAIDTYSDTLSEEEKVGSYRKGVAPCARGLLSDVYGLVWSKFVKNGVLRTLEEHRMRSLQDQNYLVQPELSGTAELNPEFCVHSEASTGGVFLVTALRQDPQSATEHVTMARIAGVGGFVYEFSWSDPICVKEPERYRCQWGDPVCVKRQNAIPITEEQEEQNNN